MGAGLKTFRRSSALALWPGGAGNRLIGVDFFANGEQSYSQPLWTWMSVGDFNIGFNLVLDGLSLTMLSVVTGVGFLIDMYASWYMRGEEGYSASSPTPTCSSPAW